MVRRPRLRVGFTLLELLASIAVVLVLAAIAILSIYNTLTAADNAKRARNAQVINSALSSYIASGGIIQGNPPTLTSIIAQLESSAVINPNTRVQGPFLAGNPSTEGLTLNVDGRVQ